MSDHDHHDDRPGVSRRKVLECMTWAGTGVLWTVAGGVPRSLGLVGAPLAAEAAGLTFLQISDSHIGFDKPANPNALGTLTEAIAKIKAMPAKPAFMIHTGDITHLSKAGEFDDADQIICRRKLDVHYVPGEHDVARRGRQALSRPLRQGHQGRRLVQLRRQRRALRRPRQRGRPQGRRPRQSRRRAARLAGGRPRRARRAVDADRRLRPHPAVDGLSAMGLGHRRRRPRRWPR